MSDWLTTGPNYRTPGLPGSDKNKTFRWWALVRRSFGRVEIGESTSRISTQASPRFLPNVIQTFFPELQNFKRKISMQAYPRFLPNIIQTFFPELQKQNLNASFSKVSSSSCSQYHISRICKHSFQSYKIQTKNTQCKLLQGFSSIWAKYQISHICKHYFQKY